MSLRSLALGAALLAALSPAAMAGGEVIGDSLGVGVDWAAKLPSLAKNSVAIHGGAILEQIRQVPNGSTVFMSLGTNDAVGGAVDVKKPVQDILAAVKAREIKLVWLGPPCVFKPWDKHAATLDGVLREQLDGTGVTYVSMRGADICDRSLRGAEGVHFTMAGYTLMWQKAAAAAGYPVAVVASNENPASLKDNHKKKPRRNRHKRKNLSAPSAPAPKLEAAPGAK
jgi:hypothetical protein